MILALDWSKAFDAVNIEAMMKALRRFGIPEYTLRFSFSIPCQKWAVKNRNHQPEIRNQTPENRNQEPGTRNHHGWNQRVDQLGVRGKLLRKFHCLAKAIAETNFTENDLTSR